MNKLIKAKNEISSVNLLSTFEKAMDYCPIQVELQMDWVSVIVSIV